MSSPSWIVLKFGGTSVSTRARWETIEAVVEAHREAGRRPVVVCSALSGISDRLGGALEACVRGEHEPIVEEIRKRHYDLAKDLKVDGKALLEEPLDHLERLLLGASLVEEVSPRLRARVMAMGELLSTRLGAAYLNKQGTSTTWLDVRELLEAVPEPHASEARSYLAARCEARPDAAMQERLGSADGEVLLTQGFIARNEKGETVLLGRGGSDTSAAYFAAFLEAECLEIWTDVPGMFTADPREIPSARLLRRLDYEEAQELATMGARVLHPRCIGPVQAQQIPLHIRCTPAPEIEGTRIREGEKSERSAAQVKALSSKSGITLISMDTIGMWQEVGFLADAFGVFKKHGLSVDLVATSETNVTVSLDPTANALHPEVIEALLEDLNVFCTARAIGPCAVVSLVGRHIRSLLDELGPTLEVFDEQQVYLVSQAASDLNFSFTVDEEQAPRLLRRLHARLFDVRGADPLFGPTWRELFEEPARDGEAPVHAPWWQERREELLRLAEEKTPRYVYDAAALHEAAGRAEAIEPVERIFYAIKANAHPEVLGVFYERGLGFECVSPGEVEHVRGLFPEIDPDRILFTPNFAPRAEYAAALEAGIHVTLDNLYPLEAWPAVFEGQDLILRIDPGRGHGHHRHVRTAGAQSKFGISPSDLDAVSERVEALGARVVGLHAHLGSGIVTTDTWAETALFLASLAESFPEVRFLNLGGGLSVPERSTALPLDLEAVEASLRKVRAAHPEYDLWMEPGRFLSSEAGVLLARVTQVKQKGEVHYVGIDTGMNSLVRPALYGAYHEIVNLSRLDEPVVITAEVVGPICETGDVLGHSRRLPETREGDVVLIATAGAYGRVMSSSYNLRAPAEEVFLKREAEIEAS